MEATAAASSARGGRIEYPGGACMADQSLSPSFRAGIRLLDLELVSRNDLTLEWTPRFTLSLMSLRVSELAGQAGLTTDTVRYYERVGLLPEPPRSASGYRQYDEELADRLRFIKGAQRFGLRLGEIKE